MQPLDAGFVARVYHRTHIVNAVTFDGTNDYLTRGADLTGIADGKAGTVSFWVDLTGGDGAVARITNTTNTRFTVQRTAANKFQVLGRNTAATIILQMTSSASYVAANGWTHVLASWDLAAGAGYIYVNDASDLAASPTLTNDTIDYTNTDFSVGANVAGTEKLTGDLADLWFNTTFLDITQQYNRRKFINHRLDPADLGWDGRKPTGSAPLLYLRGHVNSWHINQGTGGGMTVTGGALATASSTPSD